MLSTQKDILSKSFKLITCHFTVSVLIGCTTLSQTAPNPASEAVEEKHVAESNPELVAESNLSATLLYDILVASVAAQRNNPAVALDALSRAAYQSRDRRIISEAIQLAMNIGKYQQAMALAQLFSRLEPDNFQTIIALANAQFKLGQKQIAYELLVNLANSQSTENTAALQEIALLLSKQDHSTVLSEFLNYSDDAPENAQLTLAAAILATRINNTKEFIRLLDKTLELEPNWEFAGMLKLSELSNHGLDGVTRFAEIFLKTNPSHHRFRFQYARLLLKENSIDKALSILEKILEDKPQSSDALYTIGVILKEKGLLEEAKTALTQHIELAPNNDQARIYLSDIEFKQNNYSTAINYLHGISSKKHYLDAQIKMARIIAQRNNVNSALKHLQQIDVYNDDDKIRLILEQDELLRENSLFDQSILILDLGLKQHPEHPDLLYNRGLLAAQLELLDLHEQDMRKLIELQPDNAHAYNALGYTLADQTDRLIEAMELISKANELLPDNGFILDSMGWIHYRLGNNEQALKFLRQALKVMQDAEIAAHLGEVLWVGGYKDEAREIWQKGSEWAPENTILQDTIKRLSQQPQATYFTPENHSKVRRNFY